MIVSTHQICNILSYYGKTDFYNNDLMKERLQELPNLSLVEYAPGDNSKAFVRDVINFWRDNLYENVNNEVCEDHDAALPIVIGTFTDDFPCNPTL